MPTPRALLERIVIGLALVLALVYGGDFLYVRIRMLHPKPADPFETLTAPRILAIPEKGNRTSYEIDEQHPTQTLVCVHALFPHYGNQPCWYLKKKIDNPIPLLILVAERFRENKSWSVIIMDLRDCRAELCRRRRGETSQPGYLDLSRYLVSPLLARLAELLNRAGPYSQPPQFFPIGRMLYMPQIFFLEGKREVSALQGVSP